MNSHKKNNLISTSKSKEQTIVFTPSGLRGTVKNGTTILDAARQLGVDLDSVCGGRGICTKCKVVKGFIGVLQNVPLCAFLVLLIISLNHRAHGSRL